jgi:hypothetical protein
MATASIVYPSAGTRIMTVDATFCAVSGAALALLSGPLADLTGIPSLALLAIGLGTAASSAFMFWMLRQPAMLGLLLRLALGVNVAWVIASAVVLLSGVWTLTGAGVALIIAVALAVEAISIGQWRALN